MQKETHSVHSIRVSYRLAVWADTYRRRSHPECDLGIDEILRLKYHASSRYLRAVVIFGGGERERTELCDEFGSGRQCIER